MRREVTPKFRSVSKAEDSRGSETRVPQAASDTEAEQRRVQEAQVASLNEGVRSAHVVGVWIHV